MGAWIETKQLNLATADLRVAPHVGAWIETAQHYVALKEQLVAPHVGAWIETLGAHTLNAPKSSRTPCGCVD